MRFSRRPVLLLLSAVPLLVSCSTSSSGFSDSGNAGAPDSGNSGSDAGNVTNDAGSGIDAGTSIDSGTPIDAGISSDAGGSNDGGTVIVVHYPVPSGHAITLRGSALPLNWATGAAMTAGANDTWTLVVDIPAPFQFKPLYDDTTWSIGPNWVALPGTTVDVWPHFFTMNGTITEIDNWYSQILNDSRTIWVYTPPSYAENADERFPVGYFQDGQNLFYDDLSFSGVAWNLQGAMDQGALNGTIREAIIVGIANDSNRIWEYTPTNGGYDGGGASEYLDFVSQELKPQMDMQYRTEPDVANTAICGSSLGALVSLCAGLWQPTTFGLIGELSPSTWWDNNWPISAVEDGGTQLPRPIRVYIDSGNAGTDNDDVTLTAQLAAVYRATGVDLDYLVENGGQHSETYWRIRVPETLAFLFGNRTGAACGLTQAPCNPVIDTCCNPYALCQPNTDGGQAVCCVADGATSITGDGTDCCSATFDATTGNCGP
jgi:predicted alpha/beta superfamily hydrolase